MKWLEAIVAGIAKALFSWGQAQAEKPKEIKDANTPKHIRDELDGAVHDWLRNQDHGDSGPQQRLGAPEPARESKSGDIPKRPVD